MLPVVDIGVGKLQVMGSAGTFVVRGLGACVAVCAYDPENSVAALLHALLPASGPMSERISSEPTTFVDRGVAILLEEIQRVGATISATRIKLVGGAQVMTGGSLEVGKRNVCAARAVLCGIPIVGEDVGGSIARTVWMDVATGNVTVQYAGKPDKIL